MTTIGGVCRHMPQAGLLVAGCLALFTLLAAAAEPKPAEEAAVRKQLVGVWKGFAVEGTGENPDRGPVKLELTITEKAIHGIEFKAGDKIDHGEGEFALDLTANPPTLDAAKAGPNGRKQSYVGIFKMEGDTLKWCVSPQKKRPETFETSKGQFLLILKREKQ